MKRWSSAFCIALCSRFHVEPWPDTTASILGIATRLNYYEPCFPSISLTTSESRGPIHASFLADISAFLRYAPPIWYVDGTTRGPGQLWPHDPYTYSTYLQCCSWTQQTIVASQPYERTKLGGNPTPFLPRSTRPIVHHLGFLCVFERPTRLIQAGWSHCRGRLFKRNMVTRFLAISERGTIAGVGERRGGDRRLSS